MCTCIVTNQAANALLDARNPSTSDYRNSFAAEPRTLVVSGP